MRAFDITPVSVRIERSLYCKETLRCPPLSCLGDGSLRGRAVPGQLDPTSRLKRKICPTRITRRETGLPQGRRRTECAAALPTLFLASSASSNLAGLLMGCGLFIFGLAALIFVIAAIPAILEARQTMMELRHLIRTAEQEIPDTAAAVRLSGLELSDAIEEVSLLSTDLMQGVRATAQVVAGTQSSVVQGVELASAAVNGFLLPAMKQRMPAARSAVEAKLQENAKLDHAPTVREVAASTKLAAKRARAALAAIELSHLAGRLVGLSRSLTSSAPLPPSPPVRA